MAHQPFTPPQNGATSFNCPYCNAYAAQRWSDAFEYQPGGRLVAVPGVQFCTCSHCSKVSIWLEDAMVYPDMSQAPMANADLPPEIVKDYEEARSILSRSPRGAAALLRLCVQKLCLHLGEPGKSINDDIAALVGKGLPRRIQQSLDIVRVIGNEAVHPGTIDLRDSPEIAIQLFILVNLTADAMISQPKQIDAMYKALPREKRDHIEKRDGRK